MQRFNDHILLSLSLLLLAYIAASGVVLLIALIRHLRRWSTAKPGWADGSKRAEKREEEWYRAFHEKAAGACTQTTASLCVGVYRSSIFKTK